MAFSLGDVLFHKPSLGDLSNEASWVEIADRDPADEDAIKIVGFKPDGSDLIAEYSEIPGGAWNSARLAKLQNRANELLTKRIPISSLPDEDPDKTTDPNRYPRLYWDGGDLCSRTVEIADLRAVNDIPYFTIVML